MRAMLRFIAALAFASHAAIGCGDDPAIDRAAFEREKAGTARPVATTHDTSQPDGQPIDVAPPDTVEPETAQADTIQPEVTPSDSAGPSDTTQPDVTGPSDTTQPDTTQPDTTGPVDPIDLAVPTTIAIPWVAAGAGPTSTTVDIPNRGAFAQIAASIVEAADIRLDAPPASVAAGGTLRLTLRFDGATSPVTRRARLRIDATPQGTNPTPVRYEATVWAVAGRADLPNPSWTALSIGTTAYGVTATVRLPSAPFPDASGSWTDDSVNLFVPADYVDRGPVHYVVHFHGHNTQLSQTLPYHKYREQLWASGVNAVLVTPQGPVNAASGNFGKLMRPGGLENLLSDVTSILYRSGRILTPRSGDLTLTEHSGGYQAVALNLGAVTDEGLVVAAHLFDGLYGYASRYEAFARVGGFLRSNHTAGGGTRQNNTALLAALGALATSSPSAANLRDRVAVIWPTPAAHNDATWWQQAFSETLRWDSRSARLGPRIELRTATADATTATVTWLAPDDDWTTAHLVETSMDGETWTTLARLPPHVQRHSFPIAANSGRFVRITPEVEDLPPGKALPSRSAWVESGSPILVVDGFDRIFGGSWTAIRHDHAARIARIAGAATASNEAVAEGEVDLTDFPVVIWLNGDESVADQTFTAAEQALATAYLDAGGALIVSGSEVAYELRNTGSAFLARLGAVYAADDANQNTARGVGPLAAVPTFTFGTAAAVYPEDYPDVLATATGASIILRYGNEMVAGVGRAGQTALVGFPLETVESDAALKTLLDALIAFVAP